MLRLEELQVQLLQTLVEIEQVQTWKSPIFPDKQGGRKMVWGENRAHRNIPKSQACPTKI